MISKEFEVCINIISKNCLEKNCYEYFNTKKISFVPLKPILLVLNQKHDLMLHATQRNEQEFSSSRME